MKKQSKLKKKLIFGYSRINLKKFKEINILKFNLKFCDSN